MSFEESSSRVETRVKNVKLLSMLVVVSTILVMFVSAQNQENLIRECVFGEEFSCVGLEASIFKDENNFVKLRYFSNDIANVGGVELKLDFDETKLKYSDFIPGEVFTGKDGKNQYFYVEPKINEDGDLIFGVVSLDKASDVKSGEFIELIFERLPDTDENFDFIGKNAIVISTDNVELFNGEVSVYPNTKTGGFRRIYLNSEIVQENTKRILDLSYNAENLLNFDSLESTLFYDGDKLKYIGPVIGDVIMNTKYEYIAPVELENNKNTLKFGLNIEDGVNLIESGKIITFRFEIKERGNADFTTKDTILNSNGEVLFDDELLLNSLIDFIPDDSDEDGVSDYKDKCDNRIIKISSKQYTTNKFGCPIIFYNEDKIDQLNDFTNIDLTEPIKNLFVGVRKFGKIQYIDDVKLIDSDNNLIDLEEGITIGDGVVRIDDARLKNKRAIITIIIPKLLNLDKMVVYRKDDSGVVVRCDSGGNPACSIRERKHIDNDEDGQLDSTSISFEVGSS